MINVCISDLKSILRALLMSSVDDTKVGGITHGEKNWGCSLEELPELEGWILI